MHTSKLDLKWVWLLSPIGNYTHRQSDAIMDTPSCSCALTVSRKNANTLSSSHRESMLGGDFSAVLSISSPPPLRFTASLAQRLAVKCIKSIKALLFLGAGAIIHAVHSNYMTDMGGLRKYLPVTHITFLIACLAISGIPPFAGFFSKDEILVAAYGCQPLSKPSTAQLGLHGRRFN